ncbi:MAG: hypothetical protein MUO77_09470 [Anaerolineales bacterium]|nr:hypothetical protein [Anaerolineales bacterium]
MKFHASEVQITSSGGEDFQVHLSESKAEHCPYVLLQNSFEFFRGPAYFECHNLDLAGHGVVKRCELQRASLEIDVTDSNEQITVTFNEPDEKIGNLAWMLGIVFAGYVSFVNSSGVPEKPMEDPDF